jgi:hypothetical protein
MTKEGSVAVCVPIQRKEEAILYAETAFNRVKHVTIDERKPRQKP